jgi:hypothetical protein
MEREGGVISDDVATQDVQRPRSSLFSQIVIALCVGGACAATVAFFAWVHWPAAAPSLDQYDARLSPSALVDGLTSLTRALPWAAIHRELWQAVALFVLWLVSVFGWGRLFPWLRLSHLSLLERVLMQFGIGALWLGLATALCGFLVAFSASTIVSCLVIGWGLAAYSAWRQRRAPLLQLCTGRIRPLDLALVIIVTCYLIIGALYALTPPMQSDGMRYHLAAIQEYLRHGRIVYLPGNAFSNFPFLIEMHFAAGVLAGLPEVAQLIHYAFFLAAGFLLFCATRRFLANHAHRCGTTSELRLLPWFPALLYWTLPANAVVAAWPFIDQAVAFYWFAAILAATVAFSHASVVAYALLGLLLGAALGAKYTSIAFVAVLVGALVLTQFLAAPTDRSTWRSFVRGLALSLALAAFTAAPWYVKNLVFTGNPVYPLGGRLFGYGEFGPENATLYAQKMAEKGVPKTLPFLLLSPLAATFRWTAFEHHFLGAHVLVALPLAFCTLFLCKRRALRPYMALFLTAGLGTWALWFMSYQSNRMLGQSIMFFLPLSAFAMAHLPPRTLLRRLALLAVTTACFWGGLYTVQYETAIHRPPMNAYLAQTLSRDEYLAEALNYYRAFQWLERHVKPNEKVLFIGEHRAFYARIQPVWSDWFDTPALLSMMRSQHLETFDALVKALHDRDIVWVLVNEAELAPQMERYWRPRFAEREWRLYREFLENPRWSKVRIPPGITIFRITPAEAEPAS